MKEEGTGENGQRQMLLPVFATHCLGLPLHGSPLAFLHPSLPQLGRYRNLDVRIFIPCFFFFFFFTKHLARTCICHGSAVTKYKYDEHDTAIVDCAASDGDNSHLDTDILVDDHGNTIVDSATSDGDNSCLETNVPVDSRDNAIVDNTANDDDSIHLETDNPLDGHGDPNLSGITPPLPMNLVEPMCHGHETGYHVITAGTAIGILVIWCVFHTS